VVAAGLLILIASYAWYRARSVPDVRNIAISELINRSENGLIKRVVISGLVVNAIDVGDVRYRAIKEEHQPLTEVLRRAGTEVILEPQTSEVSPHLLLGLIPILAILAMFFLTVRRPGASNPTFSFGKSSARLQAGPEPVVTLDDVAGVEEAKTELREIVEFLKNPGRFAALGARIPKGVLRVGPRAPARL